MYTPFDMMRKNIDKNISEEYFKNQMINTLGIIEIIILEKYNISSREELEISTDLYKRKDIINEFLEISNFYEYIRNHSNFGTTKEYFLKINYRLLFELEKIKNKGFDYILQVWNLSPK